MQYIDAENTAWRGLDRSSMFEFMAGCPVGSETNRVKPRKEARAGNGDCRRHCQSQK